MSTGSGGGSGAGLPDVTAEDNGSVLRVVSGEWAKSGTLELPSVTVSDKEKILVVDNNGGWVAASMLPLVVSATESSGTVTITDDITIAQIYSAAAAKRTVYLEVDKSTSGMDVFARYTLSARASLGEGQYLLTFSQHDTDGEDINERCILFAPGETTGVLVERE